MPGRLFVLDSTEIMHMLTPRCQNLAVIVLFVLFAAHAEAKPYIPDNDALVLERLPEKGDAALSRLKRMRAAAIATPGNLDIAVPVARQAIEAARSLGDPRFLGQAQAALAPWWQGDDVPPAALLLRATLKQSQHDFEGSLRDLDALLKVQPASAQAHLTRATVLTVRGRYAEARRDCGELRGRAIGVVVAGCDATPASLSGDAARAYDTLMAELARGGGNADLREWALTLAAEIAMRRGDIDAAERHFRDALALDPRDPYLKAAYADFLLDRDRAAEVQALLRDDLKNDSLLLRLALAEQRLPDRRQSFAAHRQELADRFAAASRRGDSLHRREEARFRLQIENNGKEALRLARDNWAVQREPADLRILIESARAANDAQAMKTAEDWIRSSGLEDRTITALLQSSR